MACKEQRNIFGVNNSLFFGERLGGGGEICTRKAGEGRQISRVSSFPGIVKPDIH